MSGGDPLIEDLDFDVLPPFASDEVKQLHEQVKQKERLLQHFKDKDDELTERLQIMQNHLVNVRQEHDHAQTLLEAKRKDIETEQHLVRLNERKIGRLRSDITRTDKDMEVLQDKLNIAQNAVFVANERLEKFKVKMNWNQEELLQWSLATRQKEDDKAALEHYQKVDDVKVRKLVLEMEKAARHAQDLKRDLDKEATESLATQIELDKVAEEYRHVHMERQRLIRQYNEAVEAIQRRDKHIAQVAVQIAEEKKHIRELQSKVAEQKQLLEMEQNESKVIDNDMGRVERTSEKTRKALVASRKGITEFKDEVQAQSNELDSAAAELKQTAVKIENLTQLAADKEQKLEAFATLVEATRKALEEEFGVTDDREKKAMQIDHLRRAHEQRLHESMRKLQELKEVMFKKSSALFDLRKKEADLIAEISGAQGTNRNLQLRIQTLDDRSLKQQETLYKIEFQVQQLERKVARASGKRTLEETVALNAEITRQQAQLQQQKAQHSMLSQQIKQLHAELRASKRKWSQAVDKQKQLKEDISELELKNATVSTQMDRSQREKESLMVKEDTMRVEVKNLRQILREQADRTYKLDSRKMQLRISIKEREKEVELYQQTQRAKLKGVEEARHKLAMDYTQREKRVKTLQLKYQTVASQMKSEDGEPRSQAHYIIKAAEQREDLQKKGDVLASTIRKTEQEMKMLSKTLGHLANSNRLFRQGQSHSQAGGAMEQRRNQLEQSRRAVADELSVTTANLEELKADIEQRKRVRYDLLKHTTALQKESLQGSKAVEALKQKVVDQAAMLERASRTLRSKQHQFKRERGISAQQDSVEELDFMVREQQYKNAWIKQSLMQLVQLYPGLEQPLDTSFKKVGLER